MNKKFTIDDYMWLSDKDRAIVDAWLTKYDLPDLTLIMQYAGDEDDPLLSEVKLVAFGYPFIKVFRSDQKAVTYVSPVTAEQTVVLKAEFHFDDFPWYIVDQYDFPALEANKPTEEEIITYTTTHTIAKEEE